MEDLARRLTVLDQRITQIPRILFVVVLSVVALFRNGFNFYGFDWVVTAEAIRSLPEAVNYTSWSWGNLLIAKALGIDSLTNWYGLHLALTVFAVLLPILLVRKLEGTEFYLFVVLWFLIPVIGSLLMWIGMYDVVFVIGATIVALSKRLWQAALGSIIMSSGNPEQAALAASIFVIVTHHSSLKKHVRQAWVSLFVSGVALALSRVLISGNEAKDRAEILRDPIEGIELLAYQWPNSVWGWNGVLWFLILALIVASGAKDRLLLIVGLIVIPVLAVMFTYDWNRVYWLLVTTSLITIAYHFAKSKLPPAVRGGVLASGLISLAIVPPQNGGFFFFISNVGGLFQ